MPRPYFEAPGVTIYHGDALEVLPYLSGIAGLVTDPPYSSGGMFRSDRTKRTVEKYVQSGGWNADRLADFSGDNRDQRSFLAWCALWMGAARRATIPGGVLVAFSDWRQVPVMSDAVQAGGWVWRGLETWWKPGVRNQRGRFSASSEFCLYGTNGPAIEHPGGAPSVFACAPVRGDEKLHVAEKPLAVMRWALSVVPSGCGVVVDPFAGSGSTLRAAVDAGFEVVGVEMDERQCELAAERMLQGVLDGRSGAHSYVREAGG